MDPRQPLKARTTTSAQGPQLFEANVDGQTRQLIGAGQKSGIYWVFDRSDGTPLWHTTVGYGSVGGGIRGEASVGDGQVFVWSNNNYLDSEPTQHPISVKRWTLQTAAFFGFMTRRSPPSARRRASWQATCTSSVRSTAR